MTAETIYNACIVGGGIVLMPEASAELLYEVKVLCPDIMIRGLDNGMIEFRPKPESICIADDAGIAAYGLRHKVYHRNDTRN